MNPVNTVEEIRQIVHPWADAQPLITRVKLFGSFATGTNRPDSDVDLAVKVQAEEDRTKGGTYFIYKDEWKSELEKALGRKVSLVRITPNGKPEIQEEIQKDGFRLY